jgi:hypothetical protein
VTIVFAAPPVPVPGIVYMTPPGEVGRGRRGGFLVQRAWIGGRGWQITAPNHKTALIPVPLLESGKILTGNVHNIAALWTFIYKNGIAEDAKRYLDSLNQEEVEFNLRPKSERDLIERRRDASPEIEKVFREITDKKYQAVLKWIYAQLMSSVELVVKRQEEDPENRDPMKGLNSSDLYRLMERERKPNGFITTKMVPVANYENIAQGLAKRDADETRDAFLHKNTHRVSAITKLKNNFSDAQLIRVIGGHDYGGEIKFSFTDGSSFLLRNKTIWKQNSYGKIFAQFPTTFHDVVMPDGTKMSSPSEKRMLDVFAVARSDPGS